METAGLRETERLAQDTAAAFGEVQDQVSLTAAQYRQVVALMEEGESATRAVARVTGQVRVEAGDVDDAYRRVAASLDLSEDEARRLASSIAQTTRESSQLDADLRQVAATLDLSEDEARRFASQIRKTEAPPADVARGFDTIRGSVLRLGATLAAFVGVREVVDQLNQAVQASADLAESVNAVNVVFDRGADTILEASEEAVTRFGVSSRALNEAATQIGASLQNAGFDAEEAAEKFLELQLRATDTASVLNTDVNQVLIALQAALRGEFDPIERFTGGMNVAAVQAKALSLGLISQGEELDNNARATAVLALFMERTNRFAGDFANTSDSVANRQRILRAELEDTRAELGEALLPAYEQLLDLGPPLIEFVRILSIQIASLTTSMGESGSAAQTFADVLQVIGAVPTAVGTLVGTVKGLGQGLLGFARALTEPEEGIDQIRRGIDTLNETADSFDISQVRNQLIDLLQSGADPAAALSAALIELGDISLDAEQFEAAASQLTRIADVPSDRLSDVSLFLADQGEAAGLTADEVQTLRTQLSGLLSEAEGFSRRRPIGAGGVFDTGAITTFQQELSVTTELGRTAFASLTGFLDDAGISLAEFALAGAPIPDFLEATRSQAELTAVSFQTTAAASRELADDLDTRLATALPQLGSVFEGAAEQIEQSTDEIIRNIREQLTQTAQFEASLAILAARGQAALAAALLEQGPAAASAAADFVNNIEDAVAAEDLISGRTATEKAEEARLALAAALADIDLSREGRLALLSFAAGLTDPSILGEISSATQEIVDRTVSGIRGQLRAESPSKVMMEIGADAAEGFFLGLNQGLRQPVVPAFNLPEQARTTTGQGAQVNVTFTTVPNPTTDTARIVQTVGALVQ